MLQWSLEHGTQEQIDLYEKMESEGRASPLRYRPEIEDDEERQLWELFQELAACRQSGFVPCPLTASDVVSLLTIRSFSGADAEIAFRVIKRLDLAWLEHYGNTRRTSN